MVELIDEIYMALDKDICPKTDEDSAALLAKVESAYREVELKRDYPEDFADEKIEKDLRRYYSTIYQVALFDFNQRGAEGHSVLQENGEYRSWIDRDKLFRGVVPFARVV